MQGLRRGVAAIIQRAAEKPRSARLRLVGSIGKDTKGPTKAFLEFGWLLARLPERDQRLVGVDKVLLFVRSINQAEREAIEIELEEVYGANGLTEDWSKVKRVMPTAR